jgi:hypothetical protein
LRLICAAMGVFGFCVHFSMAEGLTRHHHSWGRFQPGAWNLVRVVTETFGEEGTTTSITETKTSLQGVHEDGVTLLIMVAVGLKGKQFDTDPQEVKQAFHGGLASREATVKNLGAAVVTIEGRRIPCKVEQVQVDTPTGKTTTKIYYSDSVKPYVLRRESVKTESDGETVLSETTVEVVALDVPCRIISGLSRATHVKAIHKHARGSTERLSWVSTAVPGGIVRQTSKELDENGHLVRRATLELVDCGLRPETERARLFRWRRGRSHRKSLKVTPYRFQTSETD